MFKIGDYIKVVNKGSCYNSYDKMASIMSLSHWNRGDLPRNGDTGVIIDAKPHTNDKTIIYGIRLDSGEYMMDYNGIALNNIAPKELFDF